MKLYEEYLQKVNEINISPAVKQTALLGTVKIGFMLLMSFVLYWAFISGSKIDKELTEFFKKFLLEKVGDKKASEKVTVRIFKENIPNAFVLFGNKIFITSGLLKQLTRDEAISVCLHEYFHLRSFHVWQNVIVGELPTTYFAIYCVIKLSEKIPLGNPVLILYTEMLLFFFITTIFSIPYNLTFGRRHELQSDAFAAKYGYGPHLISALKKLDAMYQKAVQKECQGKKLCLFWIRLNEIIDEHPGLKRRIENVMSSTKVLKLAIQKNIAGLKSEITRLLSSDEQ